jgi:hypothetical protein
VYYPIVYSLYPSAWSLGQLHGFWRDFGYGMLCGYKYVVNSVRHTFTAEI